MGANEKHAATYHGGEYVPTLGHVRTVYISHKMDCRDEAKTESMVQAEFDRFIAKIRAEALDSLAQELVDVDMAGADEPIRAYDAAVWLRNRANQLRKENQ